MDLFDYMRQTNQEKEAPLAARLRPRTLDEVVGQQHIIGKDKLLYRAIQADKLSSIIFYGPPGTGKTTLARVIANTTSAEFMHAVAQKLRRPRHNLIDLAVDDVDNSGLGFGNVSKAVRRVLAHPVRIGFIPVVESAGLALEESGFRVIGHVKILLDGVFRICEIGRAHV